MPGPVWYVAYGSNMSEARFRCYVQGGRPDGGRRTLPGCRDRTMPAQWRAVLVPGRVFFALESLTWAGGMAFYDPDGQGTVAARAWLVSREQFGDILRQEMHASVGDGVDLAETRTGQRLVLGTGRYETVVHVGDLEGHPMLTFTCPWRPDEIEHTAPSEAYLRTLVTGLSEAHGWDDATARARLLAR